jgi:RsiW-degrading membrane proteinase PrsW (M82 family)
MTSYLGVTTVLLTFIAVIWSHNDPLNWLVKLIFLGAAAWGFVLLILHTQAAIYS